MIVDGDAERAGRRDDALRQIEVRGTDRWIARRVIVNEDHRHTPAVQRRADQGTDTDRTMINRAAHLERVRDQSVVAIEEERPKMLDRFHRGQQSKMGGNLCPAFEDWPAAHVRYCQVTDRAIDRGDQLPCSQFPYPAERCPVAADDIAERAETIDQSPGDRFRLVAAQRPKEVGQDASIFLSGRSAVPPTNSTTISHDMVANSV